MADVVFVCVRGDLERAEILAEMLVDGGFSIGADADKDLAGASAAVLIWSKRASRSSEFRAAARRALQSRKAVIANFLTVPPETIGAPMCDLRDWDGDPDHPALDPFLHAVDRMVTAAGAHAKGAAVREKLLIT